MRNNAPTTIHWYKYSINGYLRYCGKNVNVLSDITTESLREYLYSKRTNGAWSADTFVNQYKGIKLFLKWCVQREYIDENPIEKIEKPKLAKKLPKRISQEDALRVIEYAFNMRTSYRFERYRNRAIFAVMIYAGLRAKEVLELKMGGVDIQHRIINVYAGKGDKDRIVPMAPRLHRYLVEYVSDRARLGKDSEYFFTTLRGNAPFTYRALTRVVGRIRGYTRIDFSSHKLRHTFATLMLEGGCDLFSLQKMMGHSDIKTTTIYLSTTVVQLQKQILKHPLG